MSADNKLLICKFCSNELYQPLKLPCNHSFCSSCCSTLISKKSFQCPFCSTPFQTSTKLEDLKPDLTIIKLLDIHSLASPTSSSSEILCDDSEESRILSSFFQTCNSYFCDQCSQHHKKHGFTKSHALLSLSDPNLKSSITSKCLVHNQKSTGFCETCFELYCASCVDQTHSQPNHKFCSFKDVSSKETKKKFS